MSVVDLPNELAASFFRVDVEGFVDDAPFDVVAVEVPAFGAIVDFVRASFDELVPVVVEVGV